MADFEAMEELDGDKVPLMNQRGQKVQRDIVQVIKLILSYSFFTLGLIIWQIPCRC